MFYYIAYGLGIDSALPLPELVAREVGVKRNVVVRFGRVEHLPSEVDNVEGCFRATPEEAYFFWEETGAFLVRGGYEIIIDPVPGVEERTLRLFLLGVALGVLLHQRGLLVLHASGVVINGGIVAFLAESGQGKSTTAAALYARGYGIVADDVVALDFNSTGSPIVRPGFARLKLCPEAAVALGYDLETLFTLHPEDERRGCSVTHGFPQTPLPLRCIYVLAEGMYQEVKTLQPQEAFVELVHHSYALRFLSYTGATKSHFCQCVRLASSVPICRLQRQQSLAVLPNVTRLVEEHLASEIHQAIV